MKTNPKIFMSYAHDDQARVEPFYQKLQREGFKPWMDKHDILGGEKWELAIKKAILDCDFFLIFLSKNSVDKRGVLQKEIRIALENWKGMFDSDIFVLPVRLEACKAPESLQEVQWIDLFEADGWNKLVNAIRTGMQRRA